jgi:histidine ammonia-lyase
MITQYTAAGLEHEIRQLAQPSTIDSISTCAGQEDPVSFGYDASRNAIAAHEKLAHMIAISYLTSLQAIDLLKVMGDPANDGAPIQDQSPVLKSVHDYVRESIPYVDQDRYIYPDIELMTDFVKEGSVIDLVEKHGIDL